MSRRFSLVESELQHFTEATRTGQDIDAHSLGVLPDPSDEDMAHLMAFDKERLISRHQAQIQRIHGGIRQRAVEHACEVEGIRARVAELTDTSVVQSRRINNLWLAVAACVMVASYFVVRNMSCPIMPWNFR